MSSSPSSSSCFCLRLRSPFRPSTCLASEFVTSPPLTSSSRHRHSSPIPRMMQLWQGSLLSHLILRCLHCIQLNATLRLRRFGSDVVSSLYVDDRELLTFIFGRRDWTSQTRVSPHVPGSLSNFECLSGLSKPSVTPKTTLSVRSASESPIATLTAILTRLPCCRLNHIVL